MECFLLDPETRPHSSESDGLVTVKMIDHAWGTRLQILQNKGWKTPIGCEHLVQSLAQFLDTTVLKMVALEGANALGAVWFVERTGEPVGFVLCDRSTAISPLSN
jgi:hypothetical protein